MKIRKLLSGTLLLALVLSLLAPAYADSYDDQIAALQQQINELEGQKAPLTEELKSFNLSVTSLTAATIVQTEPTFIVKGGNFSAGAIIGVSPEYCIVQDPENGKSAFGMYSGSHMTGEIVTIDIEGRSHSAIILKKLPENYKNVADQISTLNKQIKDLNSTIDTLKSKKWEERAETWEAREKDREQKRDALWNYGMSHYEYSGQSQGFDIFFQIGNPYYLLYGYGVTELYMIEDDNYDASPVAINGSTLIPARPLMNSAGGKTIWDPAAPNIVGLSYDLKDITLTLNNPVAIVNGKPITMPIAPQVINGKTMIPLRFVSEQFDMEVDWVQEEQIIHISRQKGVTCIPQENGTQLIKDSRYNGQMTYVIPGNCRINIDGYSEIATIDVPEHGEIRLFLENKFHAYHNQHSEEYYDDSTTMDHIYPKGISSINVWKSEDFATYVIRGDHIWEDWYQVVEADGDTEVLRIADDLVRSITIPALN